MRDLRTEDEIIASWKGDIDKPVVSICCITYNHEPYIEDALEGFLIQETDFPFEILIHDDASTDRTADIIREYEAKYPRLIKPIYQTENQYSQGKRASVILLPNAKGEFIALCEGDDYWVAPEKLQTQVGLMRQHPEINISFHPAYKVDGFELKKDEIFSNHYKEIKIFSPEEVILGDGGFMPTPSLIVKSTVLKTLPDWFKYAPVGDFFIQIHASNFHGALFFPSLNSAYRINTGGWTCLSNNKKSRVDYLKKMHKVFEEMKKEDSFAYAGEVDDFFKKKLSSILSNYNFNIIEKFELLGFFENYQFSNLVLIKIYVPNFLKKFYRLIKKTN